jgi:hypothetical protein
METLKLKFIGRDYLPLQYGHEYEFYRAEAGLFAPDIYIGVICDGRMVFGHFWRFDITRAKAEELKKACDDADEQRIKELNEKGVKL